MYAGTGIWPTSLVQYSETVCWRLKARHLCKNFVKQKILAAMLNSYVVLGFFIMNSEHV